MRLLVFLHIVAAAYWVGGMAFAHFTLRPSLEMLEPAVRLSVLAQVAGRFLAGVAVAVVVVLGSGAILLVTLPGHGAGATAVHVMAALGALMGVIFGIVCAGPLRALKRALAVPDLSSAGRAAASLRRLTALNLALGVAAFLAGTLAR